MSPSSSTVASQEKVIEDRAPFWDPNTVPGNEDEEFRALIHRTPDDPDHRVGQAILDDKYSTWLDAPNPETFASFGEDGVTASVNAYGELMQFSSYLGAGTSGIFTADHTDTDEPYWVLGRMNHLLSLSKTAKIAETGYGLRIPGLQYNKLPRLSYLCDRWPRFEFSGDLTAKIQWIIRDKTVLQQCLITNEDTAEQVINLSFSTGMKIRDLEYLDEASDFNDGDAGHSRIKSPHSYGWILSNRLYPSLLRPDGEPTTEDLTEEHQETTRVPSTSKNGDGVSNGLQKDQDTRSEETQDVAVLVSIFIDGEARQWGSDNSDSTGTEFPVMVPAKATVEVVTAYKMVLVSKTRAARRDWKDFLIPAAMTNVGTYLAEVARSFRPLSASWLDPNQEHIVKHLKNAKSKPNTLTGLPKDGQSPLSHIDFLVRRNLEHILSVCAIPVRTALSAEEEVPPIAITCGDIAGHRVSSSASFFAFNFLLEVESRLKSFAAEEDVDPFRDLRRRIRRVCEGHIKWLMQAKKAQSGCFAANYWVMGEIMPKSEFSFTPNDSLTDTAYQLAKAAEFAKVYEAKGNNDPVPFIREISRHWTKDLRKLDKRRSYVWSEKKVEGANKFRLSTHVWIWRTLKAIHSHLQEHETRIEKTGSGKKAKAESQEKSGSESVKPFYPGEVQREILRRFTTENDVSHKRMLAMTRSSRETRFLFHASDIVLFYGLDEGLFKQISADIWDNTVEAQLHHPGNTETGWENLLRYALALMMGLRNKTLNKRAPRDLVASSLEVLLQSTSPNATFYGSIDGTTKEPIAFQSESDKDFYFHAGFEIPFIFLTHCWEIHAKVVGQPLESVGHSLQSSPVEAPGQSNKDAKPHAHMDEVAEMMTSQPKRHTNMPDDDLTMKLDVRPQVLVDHQNHAPSTPGRAKRTVFKTLEMKKVQPFNNHIDHTSIVDIEEEWLFNYPAFLLRDLDLPHELLEEESKKMKENTSDNDPGGTLLTEVWKVFRSKTDIERQDTNTIPARKRPSQSVVLDVRKQIHNRKNQTTSYCRRWPDETTPWDGIRYSTDPQEKLFHHWRWLNEDELWAVLRRPRSAQQSKKRLIWLQRASKEMAFVCYVASSEDEKPTTLQFFDRHSHYETSFFEDVALTLNFWYSELHLSFYTFVDKSGVSRDNSLETGVPEHSVATTLYTNPKKELTRATMGFKFNGDFFDRHWTCHLIEFVPGPRGSTLTRQPWGEGNDLVQQQDCWRQRKILELHLFDRILKVISESTDGILDATREELGIRPGRSFSSALLNSEDYFRSSPRWQRCQEILQITEEQLSDVLAAIVKWESREKDRGQERPRWTQNDERRYRPFIRRLEETNRHRTRALRKKYETVRLVKDSLISQQERIRNDLSLRGSENIRYFTYVTVIFLPLGFAASIFSMADVPPKTSILLSMIYCAIIAVFVTVLAVTTAQVVTSKLKDFLSEIKTRRPTEVKKQTPSRTDTELAASAEANGEAGQQSDQGQEHAPGFLRSWLLYFFLQVPARRVLAAFLAVNNAEFAAWTTYVSIILGVAFLPIYIVAYVFQLFLCNVIDLYMTAREVLKKVQPQSKARTIDEKDEEFTIRLNKMVSPPTTYRPFKRSPEVGKMELEQKETRRSHDGISASTSSSDTE